MRKLLFFFCLLLCSPSVFAATYSTVYSDSTLSTMYGLAVTEPTWVMPSHLQRAVSTLRSPSGRVATTEMVVPGITATTVSILNTNGELGEWTETGLHEVICPSRMYFYPISSTGPIRIQIGYSFYCVKVVLGTCVTNGGWMTCSYQAITPCGSSCPLSKSGYSTVSTYGVLQMTYLFRHGFTRNPQTGSVYCIGYIPLPDPGCTGCWDQVVVQR